jgi:hypothetical protein
MGAAVGAGVTYFAVVFAAGFALGTLRVLTLAPYLGDAGAVVIELPIMLAFSWLACGLILHRWRVPAGWRQRLAMGGVAFALLLAAELGVSVLAFGRTVAEHVATYRSWGAALGLAGQLAFAAMPLVRSDRGAPPPPLS